MLRVDRTRFDPGRPPGCPYHPAKKAREFATRSLLWTEEVQELSLAALILAAEMLRGVSSRRLRLHGVTSSTLDSDSPRD